MVARIFITEYADTGPLSPALAQEPMNADQTIDFTAGVTPSAAFKNNTKLVRLHVDSIASVAFGTAPIATVTNRRMVAGQTEYFQVPPGAGYKVSAIINT